MTAFELLTSARGALSERDRAKLPQIWFLLTDRARAGVGERGDAFAPAQDAAAR
jgi:hypothetical protein